MPDRYLPNPPSNVCFYERIVSSRKALHEYDIPVPLKWGYKLCSRSFHHDDVSQLKVDTPTDEKGWHPSGVHAVREGSIGNAVDPKKAKKLSFYGCTIKLT